MRLTTEVVQHAEQCLNCIGERELVLRGMGIPVIENLAVARDGFDIIDMSANMISTLGDGFPPFPRLKTLYLGFNRITKITSGLAASLPNLEVLILDSNRIASLEDLNLKELSRLPNLEILSLRDNLVSDAPGMRQQLVQTLPSLKVINFSKISNAERPKSTKGSGTDISKSKTRKRKLQETKAPPAKRARTVANGKAADGNSNKSKSRSKRRRKPSSKQNAPLTAEEETAIRGLIEKAKTIDEVKDIQKAILEGTARDLLMKNTAAEADLVI